jgi:PAS domain S-box-containing protein
VVIEAFGRWLLGERERVAELIGSIDHDFERVLFGTWQVPRCALLGSLIEFDRMRADPQSPTRSRSRRYLAERRAVLQRWSRRCPANYGALTRLFDAEHASLRGRTGPAQSLYERAITAAVEHGLHAIEAIACERFARHSQRLGHTTTADGALRQAHLALHRWGARAAVHRLERDHPNVFTEVLPVGERDSTTHPSSSDAMSEVDSAAVLRILETIGQHLKLDEVVVRVLRSACENAGADQGALLLERDGELGLVAAYENQAAEPVEPAISLAALEHRLPTSAVHFVRRTGRALLIDDVALDTRFANDPYVLATQVRSLICMPIEKHQQSVGALLLTNHLSSHAFTTDRFGLLGVLSAQAAHALENAQLYDALQRSEAKWRTLVTGVPDIITLIDDRARLEFINHLGPLSAGGFKPEQLIGLPAISTTTPDTQAEHSRCLEAALERGEHTEMEVEYKLPFGTFWYQIRFVPITIGGRVAKVISIGTDVSARRRAEQERALLEAQLRQQQRLESVGTLASGVAHEINNPVQGIMNYAELIAVAPGDVEQVREFAGEIANESQRVATIVRNLLAFSRQEHEQEFQLVDVSNVIETTLALIRTTLRRDHIQLELELEPELPQIYCRPQQIHQILMNLITNARDAVNEAGANKLVRLTASRLLRDGRAWVRISVKDSGPGIPESIRRRIFDPFFTTKRSDRGTGLGLAVSHGIAVDHGGTIEVETEIGVGSAFHLELPAA